MSRPWLTVLVWSLSAVAGSHVRGETAPGAAASGATIDIQTDHLQMSLSSDGRVVRFADRRAGRDYAEAKAPPLAVIRRAGREVAVTGLIRRGEELVLRFGEEPIQVHLLLATKPGYVILEVKEVTGDGVEELRFLNLATTLKGRLDDPFSACALALNLKTNVPELPGPSAAVHATCYPQFGMTGARVALIGCAPSELRAIMQQAVSDAPDLPKSKLGGPWAMDAPINRGSYLFNFGDLSEEAVDRWIETTQRIGFNQIDFHGGSSFRFGDLRLNPKTYPRGMASLKAVIDKLHAAGIAAGLHTYAFFVDKDSAYVTPRPDPRLGKDAVFTLAADLAADAKSVPVLESTDKMSTTTGFFVMNSVTLQIDDELITYTGVSKEAPYAFTGCQRGAHGTAVAAHAKGSKVHHLKELFFRFCPDAESDLLAELARKTAEMFNEAGFDMIYLDALDGEGIIAGGAAGWHYGSKFAFEIARHLKRPALMEMSTFHHHLWYLRSRYVAWDHPNRGYKPFIDLHSQANDEASRMFLPGHQGWWRVRTWSGAQFEPTYPDDIEYLLCKCLGRGEGFSLQGIDPATIQQTPALPRLAEIMRRYEGLRYSGKVPETVRARLREPKAEFTLDESGPQPRFRPVQSVRGTVTAGAGQPQVLRFDNPFRHQPPRVRIAMLLSAGKGEGSNRLDLTSMREPDELPTRSSAAHVGITLAAASEEPAEGVKALSYRAENRGTAAQGAWSMVGKSFTPPVDISVRPGLGLWIRGDGRGEVLNVQLRCPPHLVTGIGEHYVPIDFTGWRYVELIELEGDRCGDYAWPHSGNSYGLYREEIDHRQIASVGLWYNNIPPGSAAECLIGPIETFPLVDGEARDFVLESGGQRITLRTSMKTGQYLELDGSGRCRLYGPAGEELPAPQVEGSPLVLALGENTVSVGCTAVSGARPRMRVMLSTVGEPLE